MQGRLPPGTGQDTRTTGSGERRAVPALEIIMETF